MNGCEDRGMIHGFSSAHLVVSFSPLCCYRSSHIITAGNEKRFVKHGCKECRLKELFPSHQNQNPFCASMFCGTACFQCPRVLWKCCFWLFATLSIVHVFLWDCGVLFSMGFCSTALILEQEGFWDRGCRSKNQ